MPIKVTQSDVEMCHAAAQAEHWADQYRASVPVFTLDHTHDFYVAEGAEIPPDQMWGAYCPIAQVYWPHYVHTIWPTSLPYLAIDRGA